MSATTKSHKGSKTAKSFAVLPLMAIIVLLIISSFDVCGQLRHGDLLFVAAARTAFESAISASATRTDTVYSHVAIVDLSEPANPAVIEAEPREGVHRIPLSTFISDNSDSCMVIAKRLTAPFDAHACVDRASTLIGRPYDRAFMPGDEAVYCSELVWISYLDADGHPLFDASPMHFGDPADSPGYWARYYRKYNVEIPEGQPGTHPSTMAASKLLETVNF